MKELLEEILDVMEIQEKREKGEFHLSREAMWRIWTNTKDKISRAIKSIEVEKGDKETRINETNSV